MSHPIRCLLILLLSGWSTAGVANPSAELCDKGGGASTAERVRRVITFTNALDRYGESPALEPHDERCVAARMGKLGPLVDEYCAARSELRHDLAVNELQKLDFALHSLQSECLIEHSEEFSTRIEQIQPDTCAELENSFLAFADLVRQPPNPNNS